jgi:DNA-binding transcriptional ArsR family regulator
VLEFIDTIMCWTELANSKIRRFFLMTKQNTYSRMWLEYISILVYNKGMARIPTTHDPFNAVAEPKRRQILEALGTDERSVNEIVETLGWPQPMVSKHLAVLKKVGLVHQRRVGRQRLYTVNMEELKPIHDWVTPFEQYWSESFDRLDVVLQDIQKKEKKHVSKKE